MLKRQNVPHCSPRRLYEYRLFYQAYPEILRSLPAEFKEIINQYLSSSVIPQALPAELASSAQLAETEVPRLPISTLFRSLSFTHFVELIKIDDLLKRSFYEIEAVRGNWSSRELKRQIGSLYFERSGLSKNKDKLAKIVHEGAHQLTPQDVIRDPYIFEFLEIKPHEVLRENNLRDCLLDKLQYFCLKWVRGFALRHTINEF